MIALDLSDLESLIKELSEYHVKLKAYAKQADRELKQNIARLLRALAFSKEVQALSILYNTGYVGDTADNIDKCLDGTDDCKRGISELSFKGSDYIGKFRKIEEKNRCLYLCAKETLASRKDLSIGAIAVCSKCGYTIPGDAPEECIICRAPSGYFRLF